MIQFLEKAHQRAVPAESTKINNRKKKILSAKPKAAMRTSELPKATSTADAMKNGKSDK